MGPLLNIILVVQMVVAVAMIAMILIQQGKGAEMGAAFGSGSSGSLFGASGGANFMSRTTSILAAVFFICTLILAYFGNLKPADTGSVLDSAVPAVTTTVPTPSVPAVPATGAAQIPTNK